MTTVRILQSPFYLKSSHVKDNSQVGLLSLVNSKEEVHAQKAQRKMARRRESMRVRMHAVHLITGGCPELKNLHVPVKHFAPGTQIIIIRELGGETGSMYLQS